MLLFFLKKIAVLFFYFIFISPETGSVGSVLRKIKLVWPNSRILTLFVNVFLKKSTFNQL